MRQLAREINYQEEYSYEQRVAIFNKYHISTSKKFINPIMLLAEHLHRGHNHYSEYSGFYFYGVSHSGAIATSFNKTLEQEANDCVEIVSRPAHTIYKIRFNSPKNQLKCVFVERSTGIFIRLWNIDSWAPSRGHCIYATAEEFCKDFNFDCNFNPHEQ